MTLHKTPLSRLIGQRAASRLPDSIADVIRLTIDDLRERGLTDAQAETVHASVALATAVACPQVDYASRIRITSPATAMRYCLQEFTALRLHRTQEEFHMVTLDTKNQPIRSHLITVGTLRNSLVHPREVFRPAIADSANCIIVVHNHPSGDPTPSDQDISVTERLEAAAEIIGIPVIDHIIVAGEKALSIQDWRSGNRWTA